MPFKFAWTPKGSTVQSHKMTRTTDGDTPFIEMSIRMLSIDAPEVHFPGTAKPSNSDAKLKELAPRLLAGEFSGVPTKLAKYLAKRVKTGKAGTLQLKQGEESHAKLLEFMKKRLPTPSGKGTRKLYCRTSDETFDDRGRLLAYVSPKYEKKEIETMSLYERRTFNLQLVEEGWAAPFVIYPSLGSSADMDIFRKAAAKARKGKKGTYANPLTLAGYEFRLCVKLAKGEAKGPERYCADMKSGKLYEPGDYLKVLPENRMFVWKKDVAAVKKLGFKPG